VDPLSSVRHVYITGPDPALNAARRPPECPLFVPAEDVGPSPPFGLSTPRSDIGSHLVPAAVLEGHPGTALDRFEAYLDLGSVECVPTIMVQKYKANAGFPHRDLPDLEDIARGIVIYLEPATTNAGSMRLPTAR